jgi:hypothetical protein
LHFT